MVPSQEELPAVRQDAIHLWTIPLDLDASIQAELHDSLNDVEKIHAERFLFVEHRRRFAIRRAALRSILGSYLGLQAKEVEFSINEFGKPWLPQSPGRYSFSASHSHEVAIVAVSEGGQVGADIEWIRDLPDLDNIARQFFAICEQEEIANTAEADRSLAFFRCWTRKEAFVKAIGLGLHYPLDQCRVPVGPLAGVAPIKVDCEHIIEACPLTVRDIPVPDGYVGALVHGRPAQMLETMHWSSG